MERMRTVFTLGVALCAFGSGLFAQDLSSKSLSSDGKNAVNGEVENETADSAELPPDSSLPGENRAVAIPPPYTDEIFVKVQAKVAAPEQIDYKKLIKEVVGGAVISNNNSAIVFNGKAFLAGDEIVVPEINKSGGRIFIEEIQENRVLVNIETIDGRFEEIIPLDDSLARARVGLSRKDAPGDMEFKVSEFRSIAFPVSPTVYCGLVRIDSPDYIDVHSRSRSPFTIWNRHGRFATEIIGQAGNVVFFKTIGASVEHWSKRAGNGYMPIRGDVLEVIGLPKKGDRFPDYAVVEKIVFLQEGEFRIKAFDQLDKKQTQRKRNAPEQKMVNTVWPVWQFRPGLPAHFAGAPVLNVDHEVVGVVDVNVSEDGTITQIIPIDWVFRNVEIDDQKPEASESSDERDGKIIRECGYLSKEVEV